MLLKVAYESFEEFHNRRFFACEDPVNFRKTSIYEIVMLDRIGRGEKVGSTFPSGPDK